VQTTPEQVVRDLDAALSNGYAESKLISELLCDEATRHLRIPVSVARVGQIAGPVHRQGIWNPAEWVPRMMKSSVSLGMLPDSLGATLNLVDWMPVDLLADVIADLAVHTPVRRQKANENGSSSASSSSATSTNNACATAETGWCSCEPSVRVFHLRNPQSTTWSKLLPSLQSILEELTSQSITVVPASQWLREVQQAWESGGRDEYDHAHDLDQDLDKTQQQDAELELQHPAIKLLDFYTRHLLDTNGADPLDTTITLASSGPLRAMPGIQREWMRKWIAGWSVESGT
jgi:thioester reductase-like protein